MDIPNDTNNNVKFDTVKDAVTQPNLVGLGNITNKKVKCGLCGGIGHNRRSCSKKLDHGEFLNVFY